MAFKSILKPEGSVMAGIAVAGGVYSVYQINVGNVSQAHATDANHPALETSRKKAGYTAAILVAGVGLIAKDANIFILGGATIIAMELSYRHAIMAHPETGEMQAPTDGSLYEPATGYTPVPDEADQYPDVG